MKHGVDGRPKLLCGACHRYVGYDKMVVVCPYCGAPMKRHGVSPETLYNRNVEAYEALCKVRDQRVKMFIWSLLLGFGVSKVLHNSIVDMVVGAVILGVWFTLGWYIRKRVKPNYPDIFESDIWIYGVPDNPPRQEFKPIL